MASQPMTNQPHVCTCPACVEAIAAALNRRNNPWLTPSPGDSWEKSPELVSAEELRDDTQRDYEAAKAAWGEAFEARTAFERSVSLDKFDDAERRWQTAQLSRREKSRLDALKTAESDAHDAMDKLGELAVRARMAAAEAQASDTRKMIESW